MGYIPLFITMGGACLLFFFTVKNSMQRKLNFQRELLASISLDHPDIGLIQGELADPDEVHLRLKKLSSNQPLSEKNLEIIRQLKVNRYQYNTLIQKAPYTWVAKLSNYQPI
jgi:hypothetical protein